MNIKTMLTSMKHDASASPSASFRANARIRILNTVTNKPSGKPVWHTRPKAWGYAVGSILATLVLTTGVVYAAQSSSPNTVLYPVKVLSEQAALTLSPTKSVKTTVAATIISRRIREVEQTQKEGTKKEVEQSITNLNTEIKNIRQLHDVSQTVISKTLEEHDRRSSDHSEDD